MLPLFLPVRKSHKSPATEAVIDGSAFMRPYPKIAARHKVLVAFLAELPFQLHWNPYLVLHCNLPCKMHIPVRKLRVIPEHGFCLAEQDDDPLPGNPLEFLRLPGVSWH